MTFEGRAFERHAELAAFKRCAMTGDTGSPVGRLSASRLLRRELRGRITRKQWLCRCDARQDISATAMSPGVQGVESCFNGGPRCSFRASLG